MQQKQGVQVEVICMPFYNYGKTDKNQKYSVEKRTSVQCHYEKMWGHKKIRLLLHTIENLTVKSSKFSIEQ